MHGHFNAVIVDILVCLHCTLSKWEAQECKEIFDTTNIRKESSIAIGADEHALPVIKAAFSTLDVDVVYNPVVCR